MDLLDLDARGAASGLWTATHLPGLAHGAAGPHKQPRPPKHGLDLDAMALEYSNKYKAYKAEQKTIGNLEYAKVPCINHPIFKGKDINFAPREEFVRKLFEEKGINNIFLDYYHSIVNSMFKAKVS